jgi:holo-[acyl-carrier protein] synthase
MILGIGIDSVEIERFTHWHRYNHHQLKRIFTESELNYCYAIPVKSTERFAARFAAKEACYKALSSAFPYSNASFMIVCRYIELANHANGAPYIILRPEILKIFNIKEPIHTLISLTHTKTTASALVIIQKKTN